MTDTLDAPPITAHDYCDRHKTVRALASAVFTHWTDGTLRTSALYFCGNCFNKHRHVINGAALSINDGTWMEVTE